jgi:carbamoyltransferase
VVLSGGVTANVKMNQRIHEIDEVERTFVYPNMGDGGCGTGLAMLWSLDGKTRETIRDVYYGPVYTAAEIKAELERAGLRFDVPGNLTADVARRIHQGEVIGRFEGRMEYGPRALGNRTIMYHAREPEVNQWLNKRLGRTEFMPFAPVTLWEAREKCYVNLAGAEHTAEFMTITFDCTEWMKKNCPAAVHVDGTARPQLIQRELNPGYYDILKEYEKLSGIPCLINTSFNMHEEPIVCSPNDAIRAFLQGNLDGLAIGPFFVPHPAKAALPSGTSAKKSEPRGMAAR